MQALLVDRADSVTARTRNRYSNSTTMPTVYVCSSCHLGFETGWHHYHRESDGATAATLLACLNCGASYLLAHKYDGGRDELHWWGGVVNFELTELGVLYAHAPGTPPMRRMPCAHDLRPVRAEPETPWMEG